MEILNKCTKSKCTDFDVQKRRNSTKSVQNGPKQYYKQLKMVELSKKGYLTATDLADYIVKKLDYSFRKSYNITAKIVNYCENRKKNLPDLTLNELKKIEPKFNEEVLKVFDLNSSIKSKKSYGGTSFDNIKKMIKIYKKELKK